ncbi:MAG TPA: CsbD family protein [Methylomirabilota bacterium]|nr:CsbD family protein [Methylomirabilota bacterium]
MNQDELKGKAEKAKGYVKEKAGDITNDPELEAEGKAERAGGKVREGYGKVKEKVSEAADEIVGDDEEQVR